MLIPVERWFKYMNNTNPWGRSFLIGGVIFAALMAFVISTNEHGNLAYRAGYAAGAVFIPTFITAFWASGSSKEWGWVRYVFTVITLTVVLGVIRGAGTMAR